MQREAFEQQFNDILDQRQPLEDAPEFGDASSLSDEQRELLAAGRSMLDGLAAHEVPSLSDDFAHTVVAQVRVDSAQPSGQADHKRPVGAWALMAACAALVLLALVPFLSGINPNGSIAEGENEDVPNPSILAEQENEIRPDGASRGTLVENENNSVVPQPDGSESTPPDGNPSRDERIAQRYEDIYDLLLDLPQRIPQREAAEEEMMAALDEVADGLKPIASSVGGAINTLRRNLPASEKSERPGKPQAHNLGGNFAHLA